MQGGHLVFLEDTRTHLLDGGFLVTLGALLECLKLQLTAVP